MAFLPFHTRNAASITPYKPHSLSENKPKTTFAYAFGFRSEHAQNLKIEAALYACSTGHCLQVGVDGKAKIGIISVHGQKCPH